MVYNMWKILFLFMIFVLVNVTRGQGVNLGRLHWCGPLCLCDDDTLDELHCFSDREIYSLIDLDERKVQRLLKAKFKLTEKLMWCSETCLCHKEGKKEFKCTNREVLGQFINEKAPFLSQYLEPEIEVYDMRDIVNKGDEVMEVSPVEPEEGDPEEEELEHESKNRHDKKKNRKHRKNKKKHHHEHREAEEAEEIVETALSTTEETITRAATEVHYANVFPQASTGRAMPSKSTDAETQTPVLEVPRGSKTVAEEMTEDFTDLKQAIEDIKVDVALNQHILLVTVAVAALAMIGVILLSVYLCCVRRSPKSPGKGGQRSNGAHPQDDNNVAKVNLDEAW